MSKTALLKSDPFSKKGFTLAELLIVVSIISIMSAASIPGFRGYIRSQNVKQSLEQVKSDLRSVQTKAMAGTEEDIAYWGITFTTGQSSYSNFTANSSWTPTTQGQSENLVGDAVVRSNRTIYFRVSDGDAFYSADNECNATGSNCVIIVGSAGATGNSCARIRVNTAGAIFKDEGVACP